MNSRRTPTAGNADSKLPTVTPRTFGGRIFNVMSDKQEFAESKATHNSHRAQEIHVNFQAPASVQKTNPASYPKDGVEATIIIPINYDGRGTLRLAQVFLSRTYLNPPPSRKSAEVRITFPSCKAPHSIEYLCATDTNFNTTQAADIKPYICLIPSTTLASPTVTYKDVYEGEFNGDIRAITVTQGGRQASVRGIEMKIRLFQAVYWGVSDADLDTMNMSMKFEFVPSDEKIIR